MGLQLILAMSELENIFIELVRVSIGTSDCVSRTPSASEWDKLYKLAEKHSLVGVCFVGLQHLGGDADDGYAKIGMSEPQYLNWMGVAAEIQQENMYHSEFIAKLAKFYESEGLGMMLLKGLGLSQYNPEPQMRKAGDVDIYLFSDSVSDAPAWKRGDEAVERCYNVSVRNDSEHHTKFVLDGISVENHYDFVNTRIRKSSQRLEKIFKDLALDHSKFVEINGQRVCLPSDKLNALFLLRHCAGHFAAEGVTLKTVLDWGLFVRGTRFTEWDWLWNVAKQYNMHKFLMCLNAICVEDFGLEKTAFDIRFYDGALKMRVLDEILHGPKLVKDASAWLRTKRWWQHRWKHRICYSDSLLSSFFYSVKANIGDKEC